MINVEITIDKNKLIFSRPKSKMVWSAIQVFLVSPPVSPVFILSTERIKTGKTGKSILSVEKETEKTPLKFSYRGCCQRNYCDIPLSRFLSLDERKIEIIANSKSRNYIFSCSSGKDYLKKISDNHYLLSLPSFFSSREGEVDEETWSSSSPISPTGDIEEDSRNDIKTILSTSSSLEGEKEEVEPKKKKRTFSP